MKMINQGTMAALGVSGLLLAGGAYGQETFVVSGPVDVYKDLATGEERNDYTYSATVTYEPAAAPDETYTYEAYEQSFFYDQVLSIEYSIYDADGEVVHSGVEHGDQDNVTSTANDLDLDDALDENMYWHGDDYKSTLTTEANITFYDSSGELISDVQQYPTPPASRDAFDYGGAFFYQYNQDTEQGFDAWGPVSEITVQDPLITCLDQAQDRRDYRRCFKLVVQELRNDGLSDAQKAKLREVAAGLREARWVKLEAIWGSDSEKFQRFADKIDAIWSDFSNRLEQWLDGFDRDSGDNGHWFNDIKDRWNRDDDRDDDHKNWWDRGNDRHGNDRNDGDRDRGGFGWSFGNDRRDDSSNDWRFDWSNGWGNDRDDRRNDRRGSDRKNDRDDDRSGGNGWGLDLDGLLTGLGADRNDNDDRRGGWQRERGNDKRDTGGRWNNGRSNKRDNGRSNNGWGGSWSRGW